MKNRKIVYVILVILAITTTYFITTNSHATIKKELRDFAIEDTASIDKIFLVDKENNSILLERTPSNWKLNNTYFARQDLVNVLLKTMLRIRVKEPVAISARENIIKSLAVKSTKVEIYQQGKLSKVFYVGGPTQDSYGTYMILENSASPFIMEIPGFRGYLSPRFSTYLIEWKAQIAFAIPLKEISEVTVQNHQKKDASFKIVHNDNNFEMYSWPENKSIEQFDTMKVKRFLMEFRNKNFNKYIEDVPTEWQDSIKASVPMYTINAITKKGNVTQAKAYSKPGWGNMDFLGNPMDTDQDNFFLLINNNDFVYAQYYTFDPLFVDIKSFIKD